MAAEDQLSLDELNARASEMRASTAVADSVIVRVECAGETKKIEFATNGTVRDAIAVCRRKFKFKATDGFQLHIAFPSDVLLKESEPLWRYKLKFNDELEFKAPKGFVAPANSHQQPTRAFTATYSTEAKSSAPSSPTPIGGTLVRGRSGTTLTDNATADTAIKPPALVSSKSAVTVRPNAGAPGSPALDSDGQRRKLEQALAEILTLRNERDKSVAEHSNTQMLYMAEKEKTEKLLAALRKLGTQSPPAPGSAPSSQSAPAADVAALQAEVARLRSDLDTKTQVIAEQQQALDAYCVDESQHADAQQLRAELDAARSENVQLYAQLEAANGANAQLQASLDAALAAAGGGASDVESQERIVALEDRLTKLVSVVSVLMEQNRALKDRLGLQQTAPQQ